MRLTASSRSYRPCRGGGGVRAEKHRVPSEIEPCLPTSAPQPPSGAVWLHEIKHDGFRVIARKTGERVKLYSRPGNDLTYRFPLIVEALAKLRSQFCIIDGEAVSCGDDGIASFDRIRYRHHDAEELRSNAFELEWPPRSGRKQST